MSAVRCLQSTADGWDGELEQCNSFDFFVRQKHFIPGQEETKERDDRMTNTGGNSGSFEFRGRFAGALQTPKTLGHLTPTLPS